MVGKEALRGKMPGELQRFLGPIIEPLDKPRRRFVIQMIGGMVAAGRLVVTRRLLDTFPMVAAICSTASSVCCVS